MNRNNNKGITLVALVIMAVLIIIIATVTVRISKELIETANFENVKTNLLLIQSKCKILAEKRAIGEIEEDGLIGTKQYYGDYIDWYVLSREDLESIGIKEISNSDEYYVNYTNDDVSYSNGITYNGTVYYKLSEMTNN